MYRPMQDANALVLDAVNIDLMTMHKADNDILQQMVLDFVSAYGFRGFMTALPTTVQFVTYESVYLPKNHFIKEETLSTEDYLTYFYPFEKLDFHKKGTESGWSVATLPSNGFIAAAYLDYITLSVIVEISDFYP